MRLGCSGCGPHPPGRNRQVISACLQSRQAPAQHLTLPVRVSRVAPSCSRAGGPTPLLTSRLPSAHLVADTRFATGGGACGSAL